MKHSVVSLRRAAKVEEHSGTKSLLQNLEKAVSELGTESEIVADMDAVGVITKFKEHFDLIKADVKKVRQVTAEAFDEVSMEAQSHIDDFHADVLTVGELITSLSDEVAKSAKRKLASVATTRYQKAKLANTLAASCGKNLSKKCAAIMFDYENCPKGTHLDSPTFECEKRYIWNHHPDDNSNPVKSDLEAIYNSVAEKSKASYDFHFKVMELISNPV